MNHISMLPVGILLATATPALAAQDPPAPPSGMSRPGMVSVLMDFVAQFQPSMGTNALEASAGGDERSNGISLPGIFLHPLNDKDAVVTFNNVAIPPIREESLPVLLFRIGFRDGIPWDTNKGKPNGVRFRIGINGEIVYDEALAGVGWQARAVDLTRWAGTTVRIEFRTNAIDGNTSYDWSCFAQPLLVEMVGCGPLSTFPKGIAGVALAEIECKTPATVGLSMGDFHEKIRLDKGQHLVPLHFSSAEEVRMEVQSGDAKLSVVKAGAHTPHLEVLDFALSSALVSVGRPFNVLLRVKNAGLGNHVGPGPYLALRSLPVDPSPSSSGTLPGEVVPLGALSPDEEKTCIWRALQVQRSGPHVISVVRTGDNAPPGNLPFAPPTPLSFHAFDPEPATSTKHSRRPQISVSPAKSVAAVLSTEWARLSFVVDDAQAGYAILETWSGSSWQRAGSLYPLARVILGESGSARQDLPLALKGFTKGENALEIAAEAEDATGVVWPVRLSFGPDRGGTRIRTTCELTAGADGSVRAFYGPTVLAGDQAYGAAKDFAIFPGLEYLKGDEASSSQRDLAYPLNDRRVPAVHKITTPLMAVQGAGTLVGLLWDATQEWAAGEIYPAARFLAPGPDSGYENVFMALFAPSVGKYVKENAYEADDPFPVKRGLVLTLRSCLLLDHEKRYRKESVVHGPHKGGLVLQAMKHWFDEYGMPEPSPAPRNWDEEVALCRDAYLNAVWNEQPPGWSHCHGWPSSPFVGYAVPLMLDLRTYRAQDMTVPNELGRRIDLVIGRMLHEQSKQSLWSPAGCHILMGELPFSYGYLPESLGNLKQNALNRIAGRENGLWVWRPANDKLATLGKSGDHTLGQASYPSWSVLRAARLTGDSELIGQALDAMKQMEQYEIPRGAQVWECPLYQPDILAAAQAIRAYCEAYRITGDRCYLAYARYWAWTGLPFIYFWQIDGYPTMRYNVISVIGSTFYTHSWLGLPVVWCGLVYAYALRDFAEFDDSFDWNRVALGIVRSAMWQQYTEGPSKGCYPDSWNMVMNKPNPADINPENILVIGFRSRGVSPEIRSARLEGAEGVVMLNSAADIVHVRGSVREGRLRFALRAEPGFAVSPLTEPDGSPNPAWKYPVPMAPHTILAPVEEPVAVSGAGPRIANSDELLTLTEGWLYDSQLRGVVLKYTLPKGEASVEIRWHRKD